MLKINQSSIFISRNNNLVEITNTNSNSSSREVKQYKRSKYLPNANCILSLLSNSKDGLIDGRCVNIIELDSVYLNSNSKSLIYDIELYLTANSYRKNSKSISPNKEYFVTISEEGICSIYDLPNSIKYNRPIPLEIKYNNNHAIIFFKKLEIYNKNIIEFSEDSKHLFILSDSYINVLSINKDNQWNFRLQFDRREKNIGNDYFCHYLGCASFHFQNDILNIALERKNIQNISTILNQTSENKALKTSNQFSNFNLHNISVTSILHLYTCQLKNESKPTELMKTHSIRLSEKPQDILFSPQGSFLAIRIANKISLFSKINDKWLSNTQINITDNYTGKIAKYKFNFNHTIRMKFNDYENKLIVKIGNDKVIIYSLLDNNKLEVYYIKKTNKSKIDFYDIDKVDINPKGDYIILCDSKGYITLFKENNKEYIFIKDISSLNTLFGVNSLSFSKDGKKIIAISNNGIRIFMPF